MPTAPGPRANIVCVGGIRAGGVAPRATGGGDLSPEALAKGEIRVTSNSPLSLRRSTINVENVVVRLWQSSTICLRANARSAFLFTGSPRSFHSLAMTKGTKCPTPHSLTTPSRWDTPPTEGNLARNGNITSSPLRRGGTRQRAGVVYHP